MGSTECLTNHPNHPNTCRGNRVHQKFLVPITLLMATLFSTHAMAQSKMNPWEGAFGQVGLIGYESYIPATASGTTTVGAITLPTTTTANNANGLAGNISIGYNFGINSSYVLGIGATIYPGNSSSASTMATNAAGSVNGVYNVANVFSIFISPGYAIDEDRLIYGKVGYTGATIHTSASDNPAGNFPQQSTYVNGVVFGVGYKQIVWDAVYLFGEANYAMDRSRSVSLTTNDGFLVNSTAKATGFDFIFGVGYRF
jgi:hypothetical protein